MYAINIIFTEYLNASNVLITSDGKKIVNNVVYAFTIITELGKTNLI